MTRDTVDETARAKAGAVWAARHGWVVFPLARDKKRPGVADWENAASSDPDHVAAHWPRWAIGYGIAAGRSGLYVVDCDTPKVETPPSPAADVRDGFDMLALLAEQHGEPLPIDTFTVGTGRGGTHLYYAMPNGLDLRNTAYDADHPDASLGWCVDTRGNGGYVVGPGSTVSGRAYRTVHNARPAALPGWILTALAKGQAAIQEAVRAVPTPRAVSQPAPGTVPTVGRQWIEAALDGEAERVRSAPNGAGNHILSSAAFRLGQLVGASLVSHETAEATLSAALDTWTWSEPGDRVRMLRTLNSGLAAGERSPRAPMPREARKRAAA